MQNKAYIIIGLTLLAFAALLLLSCGFTPGSGEHAAPTETVSTIAIPSPTQQEKKGTDLTIERIPTFPLPLEDEASEVIPTSPPPLEKLEFPTREVEYPPDWPSKLLYPDEFVLVEASSGLLPGSDSKGWAAKLRYKGSTEDAAGLLAAFFTANGWEVQRLDLDSGGYMLFVEKDNKLHTGGLTIDRDTNNTGYTLILATVRF